MEKKFKAVIFDLDGTLLDTVEDLAAAANRVLTSKGFPNHSTDAYRHFIGDGAAMLIHRALPPLIRSPSLEKECLGLFLDDYGQTWQDHTRPYPGISLNPPCRHSLPVTNGAVSDCRSQWGKTEKRDS